MLELEDYFTAEEIARSADYWGQRYPLTFAAIGVSLGVLVLLGVVFSRRLGGWGERVARGRWAPIALLLAALTTVAPAAATLPFGLARHRLARRFGLATNTAAEYVLDWLKALGFQVAIAAIVALLFVGVARRLPRAWPVVVAGSGSVLLFVSVFLFPLVYEPAFNTFEQAPAEMRARLLAIAYREGVPVNDVLVADASRRTTAHNAYVSGLGSSRRIVLYDTLLREMPPDQVDVVVAHELAHVKHRDVLKGTLLGALGLLVGVVALWWLLGRTAVRARLGVEGAGDPRVVPFLAFAIAAGSFVTAPVGNAYSRAIEARADRTAVRATGDPGAATELAVQLARRNISDLRPGPVVRALFFTHPPVLERIQIARDAARDER